MSKSDDTRMREALVSLHEQAHGQTPMRTRQSEPCRALILDSYGDIRPLVHAGPAVHNPAMF